MRHTLPAFRRGGKDATMEDDKKARACFDIGFCGLLCIVFVTLKLTGHIDWSWWWVASPLWIPAAIVVGIVICVAAGVQDAHSIRVDFDARFAQIGESC